MKYYAIDEATLVAILKYLGQRPHDEVREGIDALRRLQELPAPTND